MRNLLLAVLIYVLAVSCGNSNTPHVPAGIIQPDSMVVVLTDVHIFQASLQFGYYGDSAKATANAFAGILKKHHLTDSIYSESLKYYSYHTALLNEIYEKVLNNISQQKAELLGQKHS